MFEQRECPVCGKSFLAKVSDQIYCSKKCYNRNYARPGKYRESPKKPAKTFEAWLEEAQDCGLTYGKYRAALKAGKTFEELKEDYRRETELVNVKRKNVLETEEPEIKIIPPDKRPAVLPRRKKNSDERRGSEPEQVEQSDATGGFGVTLADDEFKPIPSLNGEYEINEKGFVRDTRYNKILLPFVHVRDPEAESGKNAKSLNKLYNEVFGKDFVEPVRLAGKYHPTAIAVTAEKGEIKKTFDTKKDAIKYFFEEKIFEKATVKSVLFLELPEYDGWKFTYGENK